MSCACRGTLGILRYVMIVLIIYVAYSASTPAGRELEDPDLRRATVLWEADDDTAARVIAKRKGWLTMHVNSYLGHRLHAALHFKRYDEGAPISLDAPATPLEQALAAAKADLERRGGDT